MRNVDLEIVGGGRKDGEVGTTSCVAAGAAQTHTSHFIHLLLPSLVGAHVASVCHMQRWPKPYIDKLLINALHWL